MPQHLVLPYEHLRLRLVESALVSPAERHHPIPQIGRADRRRPQTRRSSLAGAPARSPRPPVQICPRNVERAAGVGGPGRLREGT